MHHKNTAKITQNDLDTLAKATNENCGIVLLMRKHNKNAEPDLTNVVHEKIVDDCFNTPRLITGTMAASHSGGISLQVLAEKMLSSLQITSTKEILMKKSFENKAKIHNGKSFLKGE